MAEPLQVPFVAGDRVRVRGGVWRVDRAIPYPSCTALSLHSLHSLHSLQGADASTFGTSRTILLPFDRPARLPHHLTPRVVSRRRGLRSIAGLVADAHPYEGLRAAAHARIELLEFQLEPALAVCRGAASRLLLADEVGLGKTIQAGLILAELHARGEAHRTLVVVPSGLRDQWANELSAHFGFTPRVVDLATLATESSGLPIDLNPWSIPGIRIVSVDFIKRPEVLQPLSELLWDLLVIDEAHHVTASTDRGAAARILAERSRHVVLLTATPHAGDDGEFQSLCAIGAHTADDPPILMFRRRRGQVGVSADRRVRLLPVRPTPAEARLYAMLDEYARQLWLAGHVADARRGVELRLLLAVLYKRAFSSASSLLASLRRRLQLLETDDTIANEPLQSALPFGDDEETADAEPAVLGVRGLDDAMLELEWLRRLVTAAEPATTTESKLRVVRRLVRRVREPVIVFTEYRDTLLKVASAISPEPFTMLHGGMSRRERRSAEESFACGHARVLLATDAAGEGLNLHRTCRLLVCLELPWSPLRLEQRIGRVDRIGQRRRVHAIALMARDTAESLVLGRLVTKASTAQRSLGDVAEQQVLGSFFGTEPAGPPPPSGTTPFRLARFENEARDECRRLTIARGLTHRSHGTAPLTGPIIVRPPRRVTAFRRWVFVYRVRLLDSTRQTLEELLVPVTLPGSLSSPSGRSSQHLRAAASHISDALAAPLEEALSKAEASRLLTVQQLHHEIVQSRGTREVGLQSVLSKGRVAARSRLAQHSLFFQRQTEAFDDVLAERLRVAARDPEQRLERLAASRNVFIDCRELIAIVLPGRHRC